MSKWWKGVAALARARAKSVAKAKAKAKAVAKAIPLTKCQKTIAALEPKLLEAELGMITFRALARLANQRADVAYRKCAELQLYLSSTRSELRALRAAALTTRANEMWWPCVAAPCAAGPPPPAPSMPDLTSDEELEDEESKSTR